MTAKTKPELARFGHLTDVLATNLNTQRITLSLDLYSFLTSAHHNQTPVPTLSDHTPIITPVPGMSNIVCQFETDRNQPIDNKNPFLVVQYPFASRATVYNDPDSGHANLPVTLNIFCLYEHKARAFGRKYGSIYECPCGQCAWDVLAW